MSVKELVINYFEEVDFSKFQNLDFSFFLTKKVNGGFEILRAGFQKKTISFLTSRLFELVDCFDEIDEFCKDFQDYKHLLYPVLLDRLAKDFQDYKVFLLKFLAFFKDKPEIIKTDFLIIFIDQIKNLKL